MSSLLRRPRGSRSALMVVLLVATLALAGVLAWEAQDAARSHRAAAERALHDYAEFAALGFGVRAKEGLHNWLDWEMIRIAGGGTYGSHKPAAPFGRDHSLLDRGASVRCTASDTGATFFRIDFAGKTVATNGGCITPAVRAWLADTVAVHAHTQYEKKWEWADIVGTVEGEPRIIGYVLERDRADVPRTAYGFVRPFAAFAGMSLAKTLKYWPVLPVSLTGGAPNDSLLSVTVSNLDGFPLFRTAVQYEPRYDGRFDIVSALGGLRVEVALRPETASRLVIGGLPRSRLPLLLGLLGLTAGLVFVALLQLRRESDLNRLRAGFISNVSHELRTPLAQIRMFAETLLLGRVRSPDEGRRSLEIIDQEARRLTHLVENVLQFSRAERQLVRLSVVPTDLACQVREAVESFAPLAQTRRVEVRADLGDGCVASVDRGAFRQILLNLLDNAVKYGPAGQTVLVALGCAGDRARLTVEDEGPGVPAAERARIFDPFYRLDRGGDGADTGSGIGLAVVRELVERHGGRVWVEAAPRGGARFIVDLPRLAEGMPPEPARQEPDRVLASASGNAGRSPS